MAEGITLKRIIDMDEAAELSSSDYALVDSATGGPKKFALGNELSSLKEDMAHITSSAVPTTVRQAIKTLFETGVYADTGLTDEMAVISSWASQVTGITLNQSSISISGATTSQLVATTTPSGGTVTWLSSDTSVATVSSNGLVTGVGNGTAIITATSGDVSATCTATVSGFATLTSISAVYTQSGTVYDTDTLDSLKDDLVVTAHYSDSTTQTVTEYTLSGTLAEGTSTVTVAYGDKTTTFNVTVTLAPKYQFYEGTHTFSDGSVLSVSNRNHVKYECKSTYSGSGSENPFFNISNISILGTNKNDLSKINYQPVFFEIPANSVVTATVKNCVSNSDDAYVIQVNLRKANTSGGAVLSPAISVSGEGESVTQTLTALTNIGCIYSFFDTCKENVTYEFDFELTVNGERYI